MQPEGLPGIWSERGFCEICAPFNDCLGLREIDDQDWAQMEYDIHFGNMDITLRIKYGIMFQDIHLFMT